MMSFFRWLAVRARPTRRRWALILPEKQQSIGAFTPSFDRFYPDAEDFSNIAH
ncbi:TPA: hypothetical protein QIZ65_003665 [Enterobacter kobei]|nr:hypothetical protein [Enterobacter kobei]HDV9096837.1 hypothetical protein [Enterobacter kobei]